MSLSARKNEDHKSLGQSFRKHRTGLFSAAFFAAATSLAAPKPAQAAEKEDMSYSEFVEAAKQGKVQDVTVQNDGTINLNKQTVKQSDEPLHTYRPEGSNVMQDLKDTKVNIHGQQPAEPASPFLGMLLMLGVPIGLLYLLSRSARKMAGGGAGGLMSSIAGNKAKLMKDDPKNKVTFADVQGIEESKAELQEIVDFLKAPKKYERLGGKMPKGVLLVGPPGTGKTLTARAVAGEAGVPFFKISGSDFVEMFVGVGAGRVRSMFDELKKNAPAILFIDEIDAVGRKRGSGLGGGHDEREQTFNQLLVEMDGFEGREGIVVIAATNRPDVLDDALLRPGRFDRKVVVDRPDIQGREAILKVHTKKVPLAPDVDLGVVARGTPGFSGADLANIVNEAALRAARLDKKSVEAEDFEQSRDKIMMGGDERRSKIMSEDELRLTAVHEAGHALVRYFLQDKGLDPLHRITIIPRGQALGVTMHLPTSDSNSMSREKLKAEMASAAGGRMAEEIIFGRDKVTTGAASDIRQITRYAKAMVKEWGLADDPDLGVMTYGDTDEGNFMGMSTGSSTHAESEDSARKVQGAVQKLATDAGKVAFDLITTHKDALLRLADALLKYETVTGEEAGKAIRGEKIDREPPAVKANRPKPAAAPAVQPA